jgi:hypothetical protein
MVFAGLIALLGSARAGATIPDPTQTNYNLGVLVLKYIPTSDGINIDTSVTGDVSGTVVAMRAKTDQITANLENFLSIGTAYLQYANSSATPSITYHVVNTIEWDTAVPTVANPFYPNSSSYKVRPNYNQIMTNVGICNYVQNQGVNEVWMYAYQGPSQLSIDESKMSGPQGDFSNSWVHNEMPVCTKTYTVYTINEGRGTAEAVHSHGHQLEAELNFVDQNMFTNVFEGPAHPGGTSTVGRCGWVHNPPNATADYDYADTNPHSSDCLAWFPDGLGTQSQISCANWGCNGTTDTNNPQLNYLVWWMQNFPGKGNTIQTNGHHMRNWWDVHANFDYIATSSKSLTINFPCSGYVCDNLDPTASLDSSSGAFCSGSGSTVTSMSADGGTLEMRWGPNCSVNWARFTPSSSGAIYYIWVARQSPALNAYGYQFTGTAGVPVFSNQVYAPGAAHVCVQQWNGSSWVNQVCTPWF